MAGVLLTKRPLAASEAYTEQWIDRLQEQYIEAVRALVYADQAGTLTLEVSDDGGETSSTMATVSVAAGVATETPIIAMTKRWFRLKYTNSTTAQTGFVLIKDSIKSTPIDEIRMSKGQVNTAHGAITATGTSAEINCKGFNALLVEVAISVAAKLWTFKVQGSLESGGTFVDCYEQANTGSMALMSYQTNASKIFLFKGIPDYIKIVATEDEDGATVTVKVQPLNI